MQTHKAQVDGHLQSWRDSAHNTSMKLTTMSSVARSAMAAPGLLSCLGLTGSGFRV